MAKDNRSGVVVAGMKELDKALEDFIPKLQNKAIRHGSRKSAQMVARESKDRAPEGDPADAHYDYREEGPGQLKKNIKVRSLPRSRTTTGAQVTLGGKQSDYVGKGFYGAFQEFGWIHTGSGKGRRGNGRKIEPLGFMRSALYDNQNDVFDIYLRETRSKINTISRELRKESGGDNVIRGARL